MSIWEAVGLGIVQGVTEFLPISSDGHLVIANALFGVAELSTFFTVVLHFATLVAIIIFFWKDLIAIKFKDWWILAIGTIPAAVFGVFIHDSLDVLLNLPWVAGVGLLFTGLENWYIYHKQKTTDSNATVKQFPQPANLQSWWGSFFKGGNLTVSIKQVLLIGSLQALAILPGVSRSGSTVAGAISQKLSIADSFRLSFLLAVPAIAGASLLEAILEVKNAGLVLTEPVPALVAGALTAGIVGYYCLALLRLIIKRNYFQYFAIYCAVVGATVILLLR